MLPYAAAAPIRNPFPLILNLLKDGRQDFQIPRDFPYRPPAILQQVQDERIYGFPRAREGRQGDGGKYGRGQRRFYRQPPP